MKIVIVFLLVLQMSSTASYAQLRPVFVQYPQIEPVKHGVSVPDGGLVRHSQTARPIQENPSIETLAEAARYAGSSRDIWVNPQDSRTRTGRISLDRNSKFFTIFSRSFVNRELELTQDQVHAIKSLVRVSQDEITGLAERKTEPDKQTLIQEASEFAEKFDKDVMEVLLPHQRELLKQYLFRASVQRIGFFEAITVGRLSKELELTDQQKELFADKAQKILESHEKMLKNSVQELLNNFTREQIEKLDSNFGEDFEKELFPNSARLLGELHKLKSLKQ